MVTLARDTSSGALTWSGCVAEAPAETGCTSAPGLSQAENVIVSPNGQQVYVTGYISNSVVTFSRASDGALAETGCIAETATSGCTLGHGLEAADGIAISPDGTSVYVASETSDAVASFTRSSAGALTEQGCVAEASGDTCTATPGLNGAARVAVSPDGNNVYAAGYVGNTLVTFSRTSGGALSPQGTVPRPERQQRHLHFHVSSGRPGRPRRQPGRQQRLHRREHQQRRGQLHPLPGTAHSHRGGHRDHPDRSDAERNRQSRPVQHHLSLRIRNDDGLRPEHPDRERRQQYHHPRRGGRPHQPLGEHDVSLPARRD